MSFATALLNYARQNKIENGTSETVTNCASQSDTCHTFSIDGEEDNTQDEELVESNFRWSHEAILLLLEEYRKREQDMYSGKISHKKAWEQIAQVLNREGYIVTGRQCTTRVNTMKRTYKNVKDHNKKSGNNKRSWKFLDVMESLLGEKPYMAPLATISSTGVETLKSNASTSSTSSFASSSSTTVSENDILDVCTQNIQVSRKRKLNNTVAEALLKSRKVAEENKEKRFKLKMEAKEKLMEKLDKILEKI